MFILQDILTGYVFLILVKILKIQTFLVHNSINGTIKVRPSFSLKKNTALETNSLDFSILEGSSPPPSLSSKFMCRYYMCAGALLTKGGCCILWLWNYRHLRSSKRTAVFIEPLSPVLTLPFNYQQPYTEHTERQRKQA